VTDAGPSAAPGAGRRDAIDVARVLALAVVVAGHLTLAVIDRHHGSLRGANLLALRPGWAWIAALAPMPIFFAAAGWANATATAVAAATRLRSLSGLATVVVGLWSGGVLIGWAATGRSGIVGSGARIATQPLWFLAAYAPMAASGRALSRLMARSPIVVMSAALATLAVLDVIRFGIGGPHWIGWPGFFLAWAVPWLAGAWWRQAAARTGFDEARIGLVTLAGGAGAAILLVHLARYSPALIDAVPGARSNTTPPTLYTAVVGLAQVGFLLLVARGLDRVGLRWRGGWDRAGEAAVGVYVWHLSALALGAGIIAAGLPVPERLTGWWWASRPLWFAGVLTFTGALVGATAAVRRHRPAPPSGPSSPAAAVVGVLLLAAGAAGVGLIGPAVPGRALVWLGLFGASWLVLSGRVHGRRHPA
jgi:hypothetical protein